MQVSPANNSDPECSGWVKSKQNMHRNHTHSLEMNTVLRMTYYYRFILQGNLKHEYLHQNTPEPHVNVREGLAATRKEAESRDPVLKSSLRGNTCQLEIDLKLFFQPGKNPFHLLDAPVWHLFVGIKAGTMESRTYVISSMWCTKPALLQVHSDLETQNGSKWICVKSKGCDAGDNS